MKGLASLIESFSGIRVAVIGEAMLDLYLEGNARRLSQEAPVPVVAVSERKEAPGGAANAALNAASLGGHVEIISVVGDDSEADAIEDALLGSRVTTSGFVRDPGRRTLTKNRVVAESQPVVRFDEGDTHPPSASAQAQLANALRVAWTRSDAVMVSDYAYGVLNSTTISLLEDLQRDDPRSLLVDSKNLTAYRRLRPGAVKPNHAQAAALIGALPENAGDRVGQIIERADLLLHRTGARLAAVTLDRDGALFLEAGKAAYRTYARPGNQAAAAGAGDTFAAALTLALAANADLPAAAELASAAAATVVDHKGTCACSGSDLRARFMALDKCVSDIDPLASHIAELKRRGQRIVVTNGCFDILHRGHVAFLSRAKSLGDVLVVGVNTDEGVARLKGSTRPVTPLEDRVEVLAALSCVDYVVPFAEDTPIDLIRTLRPDVFVKGGDYTIESLPESPVVESLGGAVYILPYLDDRSTTAIVERIRGHSRQPPPSLLGAADDI